MDIWKGSIDVPYVGGTTRFLEDISLSTDPSVPAPTTSVAAHLKTHISNSTLTFLSYLPPSHVPFFLAAGPSLSVTTTSPATCDFFRNFFLSALPKRSDDNVDGETTEQSRIALLLHVESAAAGNSSDEVNSGDWGITELLVYGAIMYPTPPDTASGATPPNSSPDPPLPEPTPTVSVHALPLSSRHNLAAYISIKPEPGREEARYIAPNPQDVLNPFISRSTKKRRADALDRIVDKKIKRQKSVDRSALGGGMGGNPLPSPGDEMPPRIGSPEEKRRRSIGASWDTQLLPSAVRTMNRTVSLSTMSDHTTSSTMPSRPRSSASLKSMTRPIKKEPDAGERPEAETKNRDLLNKIVLEEMKRRGLKDYRKEREQRAKSTMPPGEEVLEVAVADEEREQWRKWEEDREEYKGVFHHTVKAAVFAMRKDGFGETLAAAERIRRVVDSLLGVFLDDGKEND